MKVLFGIQGTGNGHLSRARHMIPYLDSQCELDVLVSGTESELQFPYPIQYRYRGFSFKYNSKGGIDYRASLKNFSGHLFREVRNLPIKQYDLVINDFEPISAWSARRNKIPCIALGHQASFFSPHTPRPVRRDFWGEKVLQHYAPADQYIGLHFAPYDGFIFPPIIREDIRWASPENHGHYTTYLPAFGTENLIRLLHQFPQVQWHAFAKDCKESYQSKNVWVQPVEAESFTQSVLTCEGVLTGAGFETPAEALFLGKKLLVVPIRGQYEQMCNAAALRNMGIPVIHKMSEAVLPTLKSWIDSPTGDRLLFEDCTQRVIDKALRWGADQGTAIEEPWQGVPMEAVSIAT